MIAAPCEIELQACFGPHASGGKHVNKNTKLATMALVKRTLARCQKFEKTGISCFDKPAFKDMFLSISSHNADMESMDIAMDGEAAKSFASAQHSQRTTGNLYHFPLNICLLVLCIWKGSVFLLAAYSVSFFPFGISFYRYWHLSGLTTSARDEYA